MLFEQEQDEGAEVAVLPTPSVVLSASEVLMTLRNAKYTTGDDRPRVAVDTETYLIIQGLAAPRLVCGGFCTEKGESGLYLRDDAIYLLHAFLDNGWVIVGHNIAYDFAVCCAIDATLLPKIARAYDEDRVEDTGVRDKLILLSKGLLADEGEVGAKAKNRFNLAAIIKRRFNVDISEEKGKAKVLPNGQVVYEGLAKGQEAPWRLRYRELDDVPLAQWPERAFGYAIDDPRWTMAIWIHQQVEAEGPIPDEHPQARGALWLKFMGAWGVRTDPVRVADLAENAKAEYAHMNDVLRKAGLLKSKMAKGVEVESKDMKALRSLVVLAYGGEDRAPKTAGGSKPDKDGNPKPPNIATDRDTLLASPYPCLPECTDLKFEKDATGKQVRTGGCTDGCVNGTLRAVGERSGVEKILTTFVPTLLSGTQVPINPYWNEIVASGRTSARDPNLQQPPRKGGIRECFIPRRGWLYAEADYSFIELCTLAQACLDLFGISKLAAAINGDLDPHTDVAAQLLGISYEEALARKGEKVVKEARQLAKCFHPDTEVLTRRGWSKILDLVSGDEVLAAYPQAGGAVETRWEVPTNIFEKPNEGGELVHLKNEGIDLRVTPDHRMLAFSYSTKNKCVGNVKVVTPEDMAKVRYWPNTGKCLAGAMEIDERLLRLAVATQADGNYTTFGKQIRLGFSKVRKIERMRKLLIGFESLYTESVTSQGAALFVLDAPLAECVKEGLDEKKLPWWWIHLTPRLRQVVLDEVAHWDGTVSENWTMFAYYSTIRQNIDVLQAIATLEGRKTRVRVSREYDPEQPAHAVCWRLSVKDHHLTRGENLEVTRIPYTGNVVCLSVPATFVVVRDGDTPVVTGQCLNFGFPGGMGPDSFVEFARANYGVLITADKARQLKPVWLRKWSEMVLYLRYMGQPGRPATNLGKRIRWEHPEPEMQGKSRIEQLRSGRVRGGCGYNDGCNTLFQGMAADGAKRAGWMIFKECYLEDPYRDGKGPTALFGSRLVLFLHDEFVLETRDNENAPLAAARLAHLMITGMKHFTPDVKVKADPLLMRRWYKDAEPKFNAEGVLIPWEPK